MFRSLKLFIFAYANKASNERKAFTWYLCYYNRLRQNVPFHMNMLIPSINASVVYNKPYKRDYLLLKEVSTVGLMSMWKQICTLLMLLSFCSYFCELLDHCTYNFRSPVYNKKFSVAAFNIKNSILIWMYQNLACKKHQELDVKISDYIPNLFRLQIKSHISFYTWRKIAAIILH